MFKMNLNESNKLMSFYEQIMLQKNATQSQQQQQQQQHHQLSLQISSSSSSSTSSSSSSSSLLSISSSKSQQSSPNSSSLNSSPPQCIEPDRQQLQKTEYENNYRAYMMNAVAAAAAAAAAASSNTFPYSIFGGLNHPCAMEAVPTQQHMITPTPSVTQGAQTPGSNYLVENFQGLFAAAAAAAAATQTKNNQAQATKEQQVQAQSQPEHEPEQPQQEQLQADSKLEEPKPAHSYIGLIALAILSSPEKRLVLSDIYQWILDNYSYFHTRGSGWRNSIRHNLSLNDCFMKSGRSANGKGHYWTIHPANLEDFSRGDFRRRRAQRRVRKSLGLTVPEEDEEDDDDILTPPSSISPILNQHALHHKSFLPMLANNTLINGTPRYFPNYHDLNMFNPPTNVIHNRELLFNSSFGSSAHVEINGGLKRNLNFDDYDNETENAGKKIRKQENDINVNKNLNGKSNENNEIENENDDHDPNDNDGNNSQNSDEDDDDDDDNNNNNNSGGSVHSVRSRSKSGESNHSGDLTSSENENLNDTEDESVHPKKDKATSLSTSSSSTDVKNLDEENEFVKNSKKRSFNVDFLLAPDTSLTTPNESALNKKLKSPSSYDINNNNHKSYLSFIDNCNEHPILNHIAPNNKTFSMINSQTFANKKASNEQDNVALSRLSHEKQKCESSNKPAHKSHRQQTNGHRLDRVRAHHHDSNSPFSKIESDNQDVEKWKQTFSKIMARSYKNNSHSVSTNKK